MAEKINMNELLYDAKKHSAELLTALYIIMIILIAFVFQKFKAIAFLSALIILFVGIEKHANIGDRSFAVTICFILALGFMFL